MRLDGRLRARHRLDVVLARENVEGGQILADGRAYEPMLTWLIGKAVPEAPDRGEIEIRIAPLQHALGVEGMVFERVHGLVVERRAAPRRAEGPVAHVAPGPARDLSELGGIEL